MAMYEVKVTGGGKPPRKNSGWVRRVLLAPFKAARFVLVRPRLVLAAGAVGGVVYFGTPHLGWDYRCNHPTRGGQPCTSVSYCAYYGFQGRRIDHPPLGESCAFVKLLPIDWEKLGADTRALVSELIRKL